MRRMQLLGLLTVKRGTAAIMVLAALTIGLIGRWSATTTGETTTSTSTATAAWTAGSGGPPMMNKWGTPKPRSTTSKPAGEPRAQIAAKLTFPAGSEILAADDTYERWQFKGTREFLESYLARKLPISKEYDGLPWCKTVTFPRGTKWVWANSDGYLIIALGDGYQPYRSHVIIMRGMNAGTLTTDCAH
jgi:hypothetical protein